LHYNELRPVIESLVKPKIDAYLQVKFKDSLVHKKTVADYDLALNENSPLLLRFTTSFRWEVWTFDVVENGDYITRVEYASAKDQWHVKEMDQ